MLLALEMGEVETLTPVKLYYSGAVIDLAHHFENAGPAEAQFIAVVSAGLRRS